MSSTIDNTFNNYYTKAKSDALFANTDLSIIYTKDEVFPIVDKKH